MLTLFDSGVGGLTVLREVRKVYSGPILYLGDTLRAPYGNRSDEELRGFAKELLLYAKSHGATHFVSACNSLSVIVTKQILKESSIEEGNYTDMVLATKARKSELKKKKIFLLATQATLRSGAYRELLERATLSYREFALPFLAEALEGGEEVAVSEALKVLGEAHEGEELFLGCTHFPLATHSLLSRTHAETIIDPAVFVAKQVSLWDTKSRGGIVVHLSGETTVFERLFQKLLPNESLKIEKIML